MKCVFSLWLGVWGILLAASGSLAQSIVQQDTTVVTPVGAQFDITGGTPVGNNLFHSFSQFGLSPTQTANFQVPGTMQNVFSRVTGGSPSVINGALSSTGGAPNLYFMNPAGVVFGPNFSLNSLGAFTATTANGIGFGNNWFNATGVNNYATLLGEPTAFGFTMTQPAAIINTKANLTRGFNQPLTLIGGTVVSSGKLEVNGAKLTIAAVPGSSLVRITSTDTLLGLEIRPFQVAETQPNNLVTAIPSLAQLVTGLAPGGGTVGDATGMSVNPDGTLMLTGAGMSIRPGDVQTAALEGQGVLIGAPNGNVTVATIEALDLGVDITAGKLFQATGTLGAVDYRSLFREVFEQPGSDLLAFLKLKTGLSDAAVLSKYPGLGGTIPQASFPSVASIYVSRGSSPGDANVIIRHGGTSVVTALGRGGITAAGDAPFSVGGKVTLDSPDLANRYSLIDPAATFADLAASTPTGALQSESSTFNLRRNQSAAAVPIPAHSSGTLGAIVQLVRLDGGLTIAFADQVFGTLPIAPPVTVTPPTTTETPTTPNGSGLIANAQQAGERGASNAQCQAPVVKTASGKVKTDRSRSGTASGATNCPLSDGDDEAILKILE